MSFHAVTLKYNDLPCTLNKSLTHAWFYNIIVIWIILVRWNRFSNTDIFIIHYQKLHINITTHLILKVLWVLRRCYTHSGRFKFTNNFYLKLKFITINTSDVFLEDLGSPCSFLRNCQQNPSFNNHSFSVVLSSKNGIPWRKWPIQYKSQLPKCFSPRQPK